MKGLVDKELEKYSKKVDLLERNRHFLFFLPSLSLFFFPRDFLSLPPPPP